MAWLLIDNSNTRTKLALGSKDGLTEWRAFIDTAAINSETLANTLKSVDFTAVLCCSVVPEKADFLSAYFSTSNFHLLTYRSPLGLEFDLPHPEQIGNDRLANAFCLKEKYGFPSIAVDFGTAVTFSVLSSEGKFSGGVIAPGMAAMTDYLATRTAQLPKIEPALPEYATGKSTIEAMQAGAVIGHRGMVREILAELIRETGGSPKVVATGGGAVFASSLLKEIDVLDTDLTLEGLRLLAARLQQKDLI
jgi:type III pantothenate kinase